MSIFQNTFLRTVDVDLPLEMYFAVEIDGEIDTGFRSIEGLSSRLVTYKIKQNNEMFNKEIIIGGENSPITLAKGLAASDRLYKWYNECQNWVKGQPDYRKNVSIVQLYPVKGLLVEVRRWNLYKAFVMRYDAPSYDADSEEIAINRIVVGYEGQPELPYNIQNDLVGLLNELVF